MKTLIPLTVLLTASLAFGNGIAAVDPTVAAEMFKSYDTDGDGMLSKDEAEAEPDLASSFEDGDDNDDGLLSLAEFTKLTVTDE
ncbi:MAG: EF-hand domain-containing protein [Gammaproteobacteria bacterium]|nr:EF-hand domain-containing protein [Gammaproteobacteria bacterium]